MLVEGVIMKTIAIMDTSISSFNMGDKIIMESARKALKSIMLNSFIVDMPTKNPLFRMTEFSFKRKDSYQQKLDMFDYKFVCGTNILAKNVRIRKPSWNLRKMDLRHFSGFVLVGVGTDNLHGCQNNYTREFYNRALSHDTVHSVRDNRTKEFLESLGFSAINTGCVTLWGLNNEHCKLIPMTKSNSVIFTLTDYAMNPQKDIIMIRHLLNNYSDVSFWIQGIGDLDYLHGLCSEQELKRINVIAPNLGSYMEYLCSNDCDYVGTRLHAGIKAIQEKKRTIVISVDNRTVDMGNDFGIKYIQRDNIENLNAMINSSFATEIRISEERISMFLNQFGEEDNELTQSR